MRTYQWRLLPASTAQGPTTSSARGSRPTTTAVALDWLRRGDGLPCPTCGARSSGWRRSDGKRRGGACDSIASMTAWDCLDETRLPPTTWFQVVWSMTQRTTGVSALGLKRELDIGSTGTARRLLRRDRAAMVRFTRPSARAGRGGRDRPRRLRTGAPGRGAAGNVIVGIAVDLHNPSDSERRRLELPGGLSRQVNCTRSSSPASRHPRWSSLMAGGYHGIVQLADTRKKHPIRSSGQKAHELLPGLHRVAPQLTRWLTATHGERCRPSTCSPP